MSDREFTLLDAQSARDFLEEFFNAEAWIVHFDKGVSCTIKVWTQSVCLRAEYRIDRRWTIQKHHGPVNSGDGKRLEDAVGAIRESILDEIEESREWVQSMQKMLGGEDE